MVNHLQNMGCQNQHLILEIDNLRSFVKQLLDEKDQDKLTINSFQGKVQGETKAHVRTILENKETISALKREIADKKFVLQKTKPILLLFKLQKDNTLFLHCIVF